MNCQNFETVWDDVGRGALMDARTREAAHAHRDSCRRCASRLADESALRAGLRSLAAGTAQTEAPARVESALLAAFREQQAGAFREQQAGAFEARGVAPVAGGNVRTPARRAEVRQWSWVKTLATAATAAAAASVLLMIIPWDAPPKSGSGDAPQATATKQTGATPSVAKMIEPVPTGGNFKDGRAEASNAPKSVPPRVAPTSRGVGRVTATTVGYNTGGGGRAAQTSRGAGGASPDAEITTEFIPLMQGGARFSAGDGGQVVRVELPRSALERFGLPMNVERANERVKADVLLGEDGMARAIRFVR